MLCSVHQDPGLTVLSPLPCVLGLIPTSVLYTEIGDKAFLGPLGKAEPKSPDSTEIPGMLMKGC